MNDAYGLFSPALLSATLDARGARVGRFAEARVAHIADDEITEHHEHTSDFARGECVLGRSATPRSASATSAGRRCGGTGRATGPTSRGPWCAPSRRPPPMRSPGGARTFRGSCASWRAGCPRRPVALGRAPRSSARRWRASSGPRWASPDANAAGAAWCGPTPGSCASRSWTGSAPTPTSPLPARGRRRAADPIEELDGALTGVHALEHDGERWWRWTEPVAHLRLAAPASGGVLAIDTGGRQGRRRWTTCSGVYVGARRIRNRRLRDGRGAAAGPARARGSGRGPPARASASCRGRWSPGARAPRILAASAYRCTGSS